MGDDLVELEEGGPLVPKDSVHPAPSGDPREWKHDENPLERAKAAWRLGWMAQRDELRNALGELIWWVENGKG